MSTKLNAYNQKRNFTKTWEPEGKKSETLEYLRFVVQHHLARREHYDFRLEWDGVLLSWAVPKGPSYDPRDKRLAIQVEDHPLDYRNFEGNIPQGEYGGGVVMLWDEGTWEPNVEVARGLSEGVLKFTLNGRRLKGKWALIRLKAKAGETKNNWLWLKERDEYVKTGAGISEFTTSIRTGRTMTEIAENEDEKITGNPFIQCEVQLAKLVKTIPEGGDWLYELKYDGYRILAFTEGNMVQLQTRNGHDYTQQFPSVASSLVDWAAGRAMILDGEMVITDAEGKTDFQALQNYIGNPKDQNPTYILFDLLALNGADLRGLPLIQRKETLETIMQDAPKNLYYSKHIQGKGKDSFLAACKANLEGIVGKRADSVYSGTRNGDWIKLKCDKRQEFVIGGYTLSHKRTSGISSLLLGLYADGEFIYVGRAGTGLSTADMQELEIKFVRLIRTTPPFKSAPKPRNNERITWLKPHLVAEIKFAEWTEDKQLRQASFKGLLTNKIPEEIKYTDANHQISRQLHAKESENSMPVKANNITIEGVKITNPDKIVFADPKITKADVVRYYAQVSERMLPYVRHRILSSVRCPKGISQPCFYKKHPGPDSKGIVTRSMSASNGEMKNYFYIENVVGLISEVQMGTVEFHPWGSQVDELERPDMLIFDLDPDEGMDWGTICQGAKDIKSILAELSLNSYLKTIGGKGYHVVVPLKPTVSWDIFYDFARRVAEVMEQKWPDRYTSNVRKAQRTNKIFIDWIRNRRGATSIAPYSLRARKGALVSMPITWDEIDTVAPNGITMADALLRITGDDPWKDFFQNNQLLK